MNHYKSLLKVIPLLILLALVYKFRYKLKLQQSPEEAAEIIINQKKLNQFRMVQL